MAEDIDRLLGYTIRCKKCGYSWRTRYAKIPARCPLCHSLIFGTHNYEILIEHRGICFIATAAYGTPFAKEIEVLRHWRDEFLLKYFLGKLFVSGYYKVSPPIACFISKSNYLRKTVRILLCPCVKALGIFYGKR